ncbi:regulatory protein, luxR family [Nocardioides szechwanensis]|uniref:Regulatory protein, luxR family n=1 Tax=Nocardioides szechwanensis TaxID=1005944 RepID=A0A1H0E0T6_9ACTN|nr:helix-turn-helix transcriptional regulator [Nocardioides szechwanensis]SDN75893.1 regulatory protein, luxR family [Nocardioides szechwanensis]
MSSHLLGDPPEARVRAPDESVRLSERERELLALIAEGCLNREIADRLQLSHNSVKSYVRAAYRKIGALHRAQAIRWYLENHDSSVAAHGDVAPGRLPPGRRTVHVSVVPDPTAEPSRPSGGIAMSPEPTDQQRDPGWTPPDRPIAVLVMLSPKDDRSVMIDLSTHPCGQRIVDDYAAGSQLVSADHLHEQPLGTHTDPSRPV